MFEDLSILYAQLIIKGRRTFKMVPARIKEHVKQVLIDLGAGELAVDDEILGFYRYDRSTIPFYHNLSIVKIYAQDRSWYTGFA